MGFIGAILNFLRGASNSETEVPEITTDTGGGFNQTAQVFNPPGDDSPPLPGDDFAVLTETQKTGNVAACGFIDTKNVGSAKPGEKRLYSRDANGNIVASVYMDNAGNVRLENSNGYFALLANGTLDINGTIFGDHVHNPGSYQAGGDGVTGQSGDVV